MVKVAIAGSGGVAHHIIDAILATKKHEVVVLSRSPKAELEKLGCTVIPVSYNDPSSLEAALQGVHTVISTIADLPGGVGWVASQLALLDAAKKAGVKRFAPSEFGGRSYPSDVNLPTFGSKLQVQKAVQESGLEFTLFESGMFMNNLATGTPGLGYLRPEAAVDVEHCSAHLAGDGSAQVVLTRIEDVAAFIAASLDLPRWPEVSRMTGQLLSFNKIVEIAERVRGQHAFTCCVSRVLTMQLTGKKFDVTYISEEEIEKHLDPNSTTPLANIYWIIMLDLLRTDRLVWSDANLNKLCPEVKPMGVEEFLRTWWGKAQD